MKTLYNLMSLYQIWIFLYHIIAHILFYNAFDTYINTTLLKH